MLRFAVLRGSLSILAVLWAFPEARARLNNPSRSVEVPASAGEVPYLTSRTHYTGYLKIGLTNRGVFSASTGFAQEACYPTAGESGIAYVYNGGLWIGGVLGRDTLVSVATDNWPLVQEFFPAALPRGDFQERTHLDSLRRPSGYICPPLRGDATAHSDQDFTVTYTDTVVDERWTGADPTDGRPHRPLHVAIDQDSHTWSRGYGEDISIIDYRVTNIGDKEIRDAYVGLYVDHDIGSFEDDWVGFIRDVPAADGSMYRDTLNLVWCADNDGDPEGGLFGQSSPARALGFRFLRTPSQTSAVTFNWWIQDGSPNLTWGPGLRRNNPPIICLFCPPFGVPWGDRDKYLLMKNGEWDYDQNTVALDHQLAGWLPPPTAALANDIANGADGRFVLSAGPFDLAPGASEPLTFALVAGREFHLDPFAFEAYWDPFQPQQHASKVDFSGLVRAARWAGFLYDTPGLDTDGDGYPGNYRVTGWDTLYYAGDGIPDFLDPPPPPAPALRIKRSGTTLAISWNGERSETSRDPFLQRPDFEGYRVYLSRTGHSSDFALLCQRDVVDYLRHEWDGGANRWLLRDTPFTLDSLRSFYGPLSPQLGFDFHPDSFPAPDVRRALCVIQPDWRDPEAFDTAYYYFEPFGGNLTADDAALYAADSAGLSVTAVIRKLHPHASPADIWYNEQGEAFRPYFEYEFVLADLYIADPVYVAVTAFDFGNPQFDLELQECSPESVQRLVYPGFGAGESGEERPRPGLYPNPYRLKDDYYGRGWENPQGTEPDPERARRITFYHLPEECTVSIWTLDGDLVKEIHHQVSSAASGPDYEVWNVISRNGERVRTGLYIWSVESRFGRDVGKLAVIR